VAPKKPKTLSRFRPDPRLSAIAHEEGFMALGEVPADWRHRRLAVRAAPTPSSAIPAIRFLDIEAAETRALLRTELGELLAYYGYSDLDVPTVRGETAASHAGSGAGPTSNATQTTASSSPGLPGHAARHRATRGANVCASQRAQRRSEGRSGASSQANAGATLGDCAEGSAGALEKGARQTRKLVASPVSHRVRTPHSETP
jgi:hypothetical protein